jgi:ABC-type branched-subunit amino acid transport system ATPase component
MLALARGLLARPRLLLLDEPSLGLAPALRQRLFTMLAALGDAGVPILLVEQMADLALTVADRGYVLHHGRVVQAGAAADLHNDTALEHAYLGTNQTSVPQASQQPSQRSSGYDITDGPNC